ncbi:MAG: hypothetical protein ACOVP9_05765 [Flavobacterium stagni]
MLYEKSVIDAILSVVTHHECAVIADFGGFIVRRNPGLFNSFSGELKASTAIVYFNNEIKSDDGLVADALRNITGESFKTCQQILTDWVKHINNELSIKKNYSLLPLGNFHTNSSGGVFFISSPNFSIDPYSFGLPVFQWKWDLFTEADDSNNNQIHVDQVNNTNSDSPQHSITESLDESIGINKNSTTDIHQDSEIQPAENLATEKSVLSDSENQQDSEIEKNVPIIENIDGELSDNEKVKPSLIWQIAAAIAIVSISISLYFTFSQLLKSKKEKSTEQASMMIGTVEDSDEDEIVFVKEDKPKKLIRQCKYSYGIEGMDLLKQDLKSADGKYFVTGGAYITEKLAFAEGLRWQKLGYDVCLMSVKNSSLTKVVLGRFKSEKMASLYVENISEMPSGTISVEELTFKW